MTRKFVYVGIAISLVVSGLYGQTRQVNVTNLTVGGPDGGERVPPDVVNFQGYLADSAGTGITGTLEMYFRIYPVATGGVGSDPLWDETQQVDVENGVFNVLLGSVMPIPSSVFTAPGNRWLEIKVEGETMEPRTQIGSVGYAFSAASDGDWKIAGEKLISNVSGNVGIGTLTPDSGKLEVVADSGYAVYAMGETYGIYGGNSTGAFGALGFDEAGVYAAYTIDDQTHAALLAGEWAGAYCAHLEDGNSNAGLLGTDDYGAVGQHDEGHLGALGADSFGVYGSCAYTGATPIGCGVRGEHGSGTYGQLGSHSTGVYGKNASSGNWGSLGSNSFGVKGFSSSGQGVNGTSDSGYGVYGYQNDNDTYGALGGVNGVYGTHDNGNYGYLGGENYSLYAYNPNTSKYGYIGGPFYAGYFYGYVRVTGGNLEVPVLEIYGGSDLSERFEVRETDLSPEPGMLVSIDPDHTGNLVVSTEAYDKRVAGVISGAGDIETGMLMGQEGSAADGEHPVALSGRVYCKADASFGPIEPGDLLTTSDTPGHAMKATDADRSHGTVIGKAMSSLEEGQGLVLVLVNLQ
jgi:hypothetical protein